VLWAEELAEDIQVFATAEEAFAYPLLLLATAVPQVIFLALHMPELNGRDFLTALLPC
jgi:DNA-binding NarL/FixJ family response regulator